MRGTPVSEAEFGEMLRTFRYSAWRLETRDHYALDYEQADYDAFRDGAPTPPPLVGWWRPWLEQIASQAAQGQTIGRVRVLAEPPSDYQLWEMWAAPWHARAGEQIGYLTRSQASAIGLPVSQDWWLLDEERLILMGFDEAGSITGKMLITDPVLVAKHAEWRDLAVRYATPAAQFTAA